MVLTPGMRVTHPDKPEWGVGQVQSNVNGTVTVNFPQTGKVVLKGIQLLPHFG